MKRAAYMRFSRSLQSVWGCKYGFLGAHAIHAGGTNATASRGKTCPPAVHDAAEKCKDANGTLENA